MSFAHYVSRLLQLGTPGLQLRHVLLKAQHLAQNHLVHVSAAKPKVGLAETA